MDKTIEQPPNGTLTPRQRQRLAEDAIEKIEQEFNVKILGVIKTVNGGGQLITWEAAPLPDKDEVTRGQEQDPGRWLAEQ